MRVRRERLTIFASAETRNAASEFLGDCAVYISKFIEMVVVRMDWRVCGCVGWRGQTSDNIPN